MKTVYEIDWTDPADRITQRFTVHEALWLPSWRKYAVPTQGQKEKIVDMAARIGVVRTYLGEPVMVHCWLRPVDYNKAVGGASDSAHIYGMAVDFHVKGYEGSDGCKVMRNALFPMLDRWGLRMEDHDGPWIHLDCRDVSPGGKRFFKP